MIRNSKRQDSALVTRHPSPVTRFALCSAFALLLAACDPEPATPTPQPTPPPTVAIARPTQAPPDQQVGPHKIQLVYRRQMEYARNSGYLDVDSRWSPYFRQVLEPISDFFKPYPDAAPLQARWTSEGSEIEPDLILRLGALVDKLDAAAIVSETLATLDPAIAQPPASVYIFVGLPSLDGGVGSSGPGAGRVALLLNDDTVPEGEYTATAWNRWIPYNLHREVYVSARAVSLGRPAKNPATLLELITDYGLADAFARSTEPDLTPIWLTALTPEQEHDVWLRMTPLLDSADPKDQGDFIGGTTDGKVPLWAAYTIGYRMVSAYIAAHPGSTPTTLLSIPAADLLSGSSYKP